MIKVHTNYANTFLEQKKERKYGRAEAKRCRENEYFMNVSRNFNEAEEVSVAQPTPNSSNIIKINKHSYMFLVLNAYLLHTRCLLHIDAAFPFQIYENSSMKPYHAALLPGVCCLTFFLFFPSNC